MNRFVKDVKKYGRYVLYAGQTELRAEVANSYLNWLWWIIEPLCFMFVYSLVFGIFFGASEPHFNVFVYIGVTLWDFFSHMLSSSVKVVRNNKPIVSKVYIPKYMLLFVKLYVNAFKLFVALGILFVMVLVSGVKLSIHVLWIIPILLTLFVVTFAICAFLLHFGVYVDDLAKVTAIFLRMLFYLTGVFYNLEEKVTQALGSTIAVLVGHCNPMASLIQAMRDAILYAKMPDLPFLIGWLVAGLAVSALGIHTIYKNENSYVKVI